MDIILKLVIIVSVCLLVEIKLITCISYNEQFLEQLPLQAIVSTGTDTRLYTSEEFTRTCFAKIDYRSICAEFGPKCEFKFEWSLPESLLELTKSGFDARIRIENDLPVRLLANPDYEVYSSHLIVANIGFSHQGLWSCNFKFINKDNTKVDSWQHSFAIEIIENGVRGSPCLTNDHCSSSNCTDEVCICDSDEPISIDGSCLKAPKLGERCSMDIDCEKNIEDATCWCSSTDENNLCDNHKTCQCPPSYIAVNLGLGRYRCLKKARIGQHCYRSQQCEAVDTNTYCSFKNRCSCKSGHSCPTSGIKTCSNSSECSNVNEYCGNGRCQVVKDLQESCETSDQCERNALCSPITQQCVCASGYKVSPTKMTCIPQGYCSNDLDCENGFCDTNKTSCIPGVQLSGRCNTTKQCLSRDQNSYCDGDTSQCTCGIGYYVSSQNVCLLEGKCRVNADCREDQNGLCYYEECIYTKPLLSQCKDSRQCYLETPYSYCDTMEPFLDQSQCSCLNGYNNLAENELDIANDDKNMIDNDLPSDCKKWRDCNSDRDCDKIINSYCDLSQAKCLCKDGYNFLNVDGYCYKKSLSPKPDKGQFWMDIWSQYYVYIIIAAVLTGLLTSILICCCCNLYQKDVIDENSRRSRHSPRRTREGHDRPVTGVYIQHQPTAPPELHTQSPSITHSPQAPQTISRHF